eukprot:CAMPEP_0115468062 /NCGR_PEP_ID=MMETSP0271-20121206/50756_1 /TAXON_ID=71861 /ORGANISM="Scrippsiella trochoidea, Strain CCMP3099" /LENGTH=249 /DNA_ID=CAMNT_0002895089 /DNA_START=1 /DNA_END=750 /DNA_ORIENTATION=-
MEPISVVLATGMIAVCAHKVRRQPLTDAFTLPKVMENQSVLNTCLLEVVVVHLRRVELAPRFAGRGLVARVKYGSPGESAWCDCAEATAGEASQQHDTELASSVDIGQSCLFLRQRHYVPQIRIRLRSPHLGRTFGKAECTLHLMERRAHEMDLTLTSTGLHAKEKIGKIRIAMEARLVPKYSLQEIFHVVNAQRRNEGFVVGLTPVCRGIRDAGSVTTEGSEDHAHAGVADVIRGVPIASSGLQHQLR